MVDCGGWFGVPRGLFISATEGSAEVRGRVVRWGRACGRVVGGMEEGWETRGVRCVGLFGVWAIVEGLGGCGGGEAWRVEGTGSGDRARGRNLVRRMAMLFTEKMTLEKVRVGGGAGG